MLRFLFVLVTVHVTATFAQFDTYRLPNNTRPETYDVSIRTWIDEDNATFTGSVRIGIVALESTNFIRLHHDVLRIESVRVFSTNEVPINIGDLLYNSQYDFLTIPIVGVLLPQGTRYFVEIDYVGVMNMHSGFYRSLYFVNDTEVWFASTQFEATYARSAFPCYDEPALKSNFTIRITHSSTYSAISNMPAISETTNPDGSVTTLFESTPVMSTYLVAFHVSEFPHVTSSPPRPITQRMFTRSTAVGLGNLTLEAGESLIEAISDYIGIEYALPKMDHIAVPGFSSGSGENWGLIAYDEFYALYNQTDDFYTKRLYAVQTVAHSLAHQFFGNLVTPSWWTYLWMKEGFATFFEYLGVHLVHPEWQMLNYFLVDVTHVIFRTDSNEYAQPMTHYVEHPLDIDFQFSSIAYQKAAAVLRMFWYMFGQETFMRGVTWYLEDNAYSDADEEELFELLDLSVWLEAEVIIPPTVDVPTIMSSWTRQAGFPLISVERNYDDRTDQVTLRQERYYSYPPPIRENSTWWVPYNTMTPSNPGANDTLRADGWIPQNNYSWEITVDSLSANDYLVINKQAAGYYRVIYDERNYRLISDAMVRNIHDFRVTNVAQLINDAVEFYETGRLNITTILDLFRCLEFEGNYVSWNPAFNFITYINQNIRGHQNYPIWADFIRSLTEHLYETVGIEDIQDEPIVRKMARESVVHLACLMGSVHCRSDATRQLRRHIETGEEFHQNIRQVLMCASMRSATRTDFHVMWDRLKSIPREDFIGRSAIMNMLGCSTSRPILSEYVRSAFNLTIWSPFERYNVIDSILLNGGNTGIDAMLDFFIENAAETMEVFGTWFVQDLAYYIRNAEHIERFIVYQNILIDAGLLEPEYFDFHMEIIDQSVRWLNTQGEVVNTWLMENFV